MDSTTAHAPDDDTGVGAEVRECLLLLGLSVTVTAVVTVAAQAALSLLG